MPIQTTSIDNTSGDGYDFPEAFVTYTVNANVIVDGEGGNGVTGSSGYDSVFNQGQIVGYGGGINLSGGHNYICNGANGLIGANSATGASGIIFDGSGTVLNYGTVVGTLLAIYVTGGSTVRNFGNVSGNTDGIDVFNSSVSETIYNKGTIDGVDVGVEVEVTSATNYIQNAGNIHGDDAAVKTSSSSGSLQLTNSGVLDGDVLLGDTGGDKVLNTGEIDGNVRLGNGANTFDGRGGSIEHGYIAGGSKVDTVYLGSDGESVNAGAGHDTMYAGNGNDTFAFTSYAAANSDTIFGFNVTHDVVQLNHAQFTKLTAGATPAFSIGSAATSPHDYLFYNSGSGNLFYDPDGSGAGHANLIAKLDAGLHMTAHDFKVI